MAIGNVSPNPEPGELASQFGPSTRVSWLLSLTASEEKAHSERVLPGRRIKSGRDARSPSPNRSESTLIRITDVDSMD